MQLRKREGKEEGVPKYLFLSEKGILKSGYTVEGMWKSNDLIGEQSLKASRYDI